MITMIEKFCIVFLYFVSIPLKVDLAEWEVFRWLVADCCLTRNFLQFSFA